MEFNSKQFLDDMMSAYRSSHKYQDDTRMEIALRKTKFEANLDEMWANYMKGNALQLEEYFKGVNRIKSVGCKVLRNSAGQHKIVFPKVGD